MLFLDIKFKYIYIIIFYFIVYFLFSIRMSAVSEELIQKMLRGEGYSEELESRIKDVEVTAEEGQRISDSLLLNVKYKI